MVVASNMRPTARCVASGSVLGGGITSAARHRHDRRLARPSATASLVTPPITLVVPTLNEASWLPALLDSASRQTRAFAEVIVSDGRSTDGTPDVAARFRATVLE